MVWCKCSFSQSSFYFLHLSLLPVKRTWEVRCSRSDRELGKAVLTFTAMNVESVSLDAFLYDIWRCSYLEEKQTKTVTMCKMAAELAQVIKTSIEDLKWPIT